MALQPQDRRRLATVKFRVNSLAGSTSPAPGRLGARLSAARLRQSQAYNLKAD